MPNFKDEITDFYSYLSPADGFGNATIDARTGAAASNSTASNAKPISIQADQFLKEKIISGYFSGEYFLELKNKLPNTPPSGLNDLSLPQQLMLNAIKGVYNVVFQPCGIASSAALYTPYFCDLPKPAPAPPKPPAKPAPPPPPKPANPPTSPKSNQKPAGGQPAPPPPPAPPPTLPSINDIPRNYFGEVCAAPDTPPIDFSMVFIRAPMLSRTTSNAELLKLYLTAMPPTFANQLMPYCDVEFQLPVATVNNTTNIRRPSLYRFLVGSGADYSKLTEADKSIAYINKPDPQKKNFPGGGENQAFFGMEMFTTPQTLVDMGALRKNDSTGQARLNDAKPFLPLATIKDVGITVQMAGAGSYGKRNASIKLHVHDRKRLVEMGEFFRGSDGYSKATVWITYGMLAPRNRGNDDLYAKLINENMLVREAYGISNQQFSFTADGGCEVTLTLAARGGRRIQETPITFDGIQQLKNSLNDLLQSIKEDAGFFGEERNPKLGFSKQEIRMAQFVSSAAAGTVPSTEEEIKEFRAAVQSVKSALQTSVSGRGSSFNKERATKVLDDLEKAVIANERLQTEGRNFVGKKLAGLTNEKDPFLPAIEKNDVVNFHSVIAAASPPIKNLFEFALEEDGKLNYFDVTMADPKVINRASHVSFGRLFSSFCLPSILYAIANEFNWTKSDITADDGRIKCPIECQVIFYQLNNHCGPISSHNIAEFPMNVPIFTEAFNKFIAASGGDAINLSQMFELINDQFSDPRQPGYGKSAFYKPFNVKEEGLQPATNEQAFNKSLDNWAGKYGGEFINPNLVFELEVGYYNISTKITTTGARSKDLLFSLAGQVAAGYNTPSYQRFTDGNIKTIVKLHIFDRTCNPLDSAMKKLRIAADGTYFFTSSEHSDPNSDNQKYLQAINAKQVRDLPGNMTYDPRTGKYSVGGQDIAVNIGRGKDALIEFLGNKVPYIQIGTEGSLISNVNLQSKTDGLIGTIALQGGSQRRENSIATTGLSQEQYNFPMILYPAQLSMETAGCPIATIAQHFFIDFDTNTTLDNNYVVTQLQHSFGQGKYTTNWTLCYYDGYGRTLSDNDLTTKLKDFESALKAANEKKAAAFKAADEVYGE